MLIPVPRDVFPFLLTRPSQGVTDGLPCSLSVKKFLLTRPSQGVTYDYNEVIGDADISTHTPLAGRDAAVAGGVETTGISTHTPLAGRDQKVQRSDTR